MATRHIVTIALVLLAIGGTSVVAEQVEVEVPANDDDFVSLINEVVKKATILRVKRNNAGFSDLGESNEEEHEVDEEMVASGLDSKSCIAKAAHCTTKARTCKGSLATCDEAVQSCVTAARDCKVSSNRKREKEQDQQPEKIDNKAQVSDTDKQLQEGDENQQQVITATEETQQSLDHSKRSPSSVQDGQPEVLDEDFDQDKLEKDELSHEEGSEKQISQEAVAGSNEAAQISSPEETNLAEQALALLEEDEDMLEEHEGDAVYVSDDESDDSSLDGAPVFEHKEELGEVNWDTSEDEDSDAQHDDEEAQDDLGEDQDDLQTISDSETDQGDHEDLGEDQDDLQTVSDSEADQDDGIVDGEYLVYDADEEE